VNVDTAQVIVSCEKKRRPAGRVLWLFARVKLEMRQLSQEQDIETF